MQLDQLRFSNRFTNELPADPVESNVPRQVNSGCYSKVTPRKTSAPELVAISKSAANLLDLNEEQLKSTEFLQVFSGNKLLAGMEPHASCYGGHQFGQWAGQLGDGRAINLGEIINQKNEHWTLQLKGSGLTPYSRSADGLAVLRSSIREFLCSEAMHFLGVPTTRALSIALTGDMVIRDMFYDGNPQQEPGAVVCRLAQSFTRFGHFEIYAARNDQKTLKKLLQFTITNDFPDLDIKDPTSLSHDEIYRWFQEVCERTLTTVVHWMRVGFVHGVLNTDNMSILGLTIDYGPYGWLEDFDPHWTPNTTDATHHRYAYGRQIQIAQWNLTRLANALVTVTGDTEPYEKILKANQQNFDNSWQQMMLHKLGLNSAAENSDELLSKLIKFLGCREIDMTLFFRQLAELPMDKFSMADQQSINTAATSLKPAFYQDSDLTVSEMKLFTEFLSAYHQGISEQNIKDEDRKSSMNRINPLYVLRNYLAQQAIDKAHEGDYTMVHELLKVLEKPYEYQAGMDQYLQKRPEWARHKPGCSMLSCSS